MELKEKQFNIKHHIEISENGEIRFEDKEKWEKNKANFTGKKADLILKKQVKDRSRQEEKYFHGVVCQMIAEEMGIAPQEAKEFLKELFLKERIFLLILNLLYYCD
jgi:ribosomal protein S25